MKQTEVIMGMPVTVEIVDKHVSQEQIGSVLDYFRDVDERFSTYKQSSEISQINAGKRPKNDASEEMQEVFLLAEQTKHETDGYFEIERNGKMDPSGIVKGWAIQKAAEMLRKKGFTDFYIDAGGDIQVAGKNQFGKAWTVGIRNPFNRQEIVKALQIVSEGVATSGTYIRGEHIYNPHSTLLDQKDSPIVSLTVIGDNIYEADRFATAAFAMGKKGIQFIEMRKNLEGYMIDKDGRATMTSGFEKYVV